jgi:hypothetical protein
MNPQDEEWGEERLIPAVAANAGRSVAELIPTLMAEADRCDDDERLNFLRLLVNFTPVRDPRHIDGSRRVIDDVNDPVIADANPPFVIAAFEFFAARRPGSRCQLLKVRYHAGNNFSW